jgi:hypothetical protein
LNGKLVAADREIFKNDFDRLGVFLEHLLKQRRKPRTVLSLKITEVSNDDRRILKSFVRRALS